MFPAFCKKYQALVNAFICYQLALTNSKLHMTSFNPDSVVKILDFATHTTATSAICWYLSLNPQNWASLSVKIRENVPIGRSVLCRPMGMLPTIEPFVQTNRNVFPKLRQLKKKKSWRKEKKSPSQPLKSEKNASKTYPEVSWHMWEG